MSEQPNLIVASRVISHFTIALVISFEAGERREVSRLARQIVRAASDAGFPLIRSAADLVISQLRESGPVLPHALDAGVVDLVVEVERTSSALDSAAGAFTH